MFDLTLPARTPLPQPPFLPTTRAEMDAIGWDTLDILLVMGDAYVDHPSFGAAVIGRILEAEGLRVAIIPNPTGATTCAISASSARRASSSP